MSLPQDFANDIVRNAKTLPHDLLLRLITQYQKSLQIPDTDLEIDHSVFSPLIDSHDQSVTIKQRAMIEEDDSINHFNSVYSKRIPPTVYSDPLVYDFSNTNNVTISSGDDKMKFGGGAFLNESITNNKITINHHSHLKVTDSVSIAFWLYFSSAPSGNGYVISFGNRNQYAIALSGEGTLRGRINYTSGKPLLSTAAPLSVGWHHVVFAVKSGEQKLYLDTVLQDSSSQTGTIRTGTDKCIILNNSSGNSPLGKDNGISWLSVIHGYVPDDPNWINNDYNGIRDVSKLDEIVCIPFVADIRAQPPATTNLFISGV